MMTHEGYPLTIQDDTIAVRWILPTNLTRRQLVQSLRQLVELDRGQTHEMDLCAHLYADKVVFHLSYRNCDIFTVWVKENRQSVASILAAIGSQGGQTS